MEFDRHANAPAHEKNTSTSHLTSKSSSNSPRRGLRQTVSVRPPSVVAASRESIIVEHYSEVVQVFDCHKAAIDRLKRGTNEIKDTYDRVDAALRTDNAR